MQKKHSFKFASLLFSVLVSFSGAAFAAEAGSQGNGSGSSFTGSPKPATIAFGNNGSVYAPGDFGIILKYFYADLDSLYSGDDSVSFSRPAAGVSGKKESERVLNQGVVTLRAGIWKNIDIRAVIPFFDKELNRSSAKMDFSDSQSGLGDIKVYARYQVMSQKKKQPCNLAIGIGVKTPTGSTDETDSSGAYPGYLQPGSGSWDPIIEVGAHKIVGKHWLSTSYEYMMTTEGELGNQDFEKPDTFKYNFGYAYALNNFFDVQLELNGQWQSKAEKAGVKNANSGGNIIYLTPGVHLKMTKKAHLALVAAVPVWRDLNGTQVSEDYKLEAKLAMKF